MTTQLRWLTPEQLRDEVERFRSEFWPDGAIPVDIDHIVDVQLGLDVVPEVGLWDDFELDGWLSADRSMIFIDGDSYLRDKYSNRRRFTLAEEAGHWFLHEYLYADAAFESLEGFLQFHREFTEKDVKSYEWQAKMFAGMLLVPGLELEARIQVEVERLRERGHEFDPTVEVEAILISERLGHYFDVSCAVALRRGYDEGHWEHKYVNSNRRA